MVRAAVACRQLKSASQWHRAVNCVALRCQAGQMGAPCTDVVWLCDAQLVQKGCLLSQHAHARSPVCAERSAALIGWGPAWPSPHTI